MQGSDYTVFVVERRWADALTSQAEFVVGTTLPSVNPVCSDTSAHDAALAIGYVYYNGGPQFVEDQSCSAIFGDSPPAVTAQAVGNLLVEHGVRFDRSQGHQLWMKGTLVEVNSYTGSILYAQGGAIGRAFLDSYPATSDQRFRGDIAEVIVYDAALSNTDLIAVESYLQAHWKN